MNTDVVTRLDIVLADEFAKTLGSERLKQALSPGFADLRLYALYLVQTYHYTKHNPRHQALVVTVDRDIPMGYAQYCLRHALEEWGHEQMAHHDLKRIGGCSDVSKWPEPLPETQALIDYLYSISTSGCIYRRLGYTFWAERCYGFINLALKGMATSLSLDNSAMSFLVAHSVIDEKHARDVESVVRDYVVSSDDESAVQDAMVTSLRLTTSMMDAVFDKYVAIKNSRSDSHSVFFESLHATP